MHPLTAAITSAIEEFSANHQSLRQLMINTLVAIVEGKVGPLLAAEKRRADAFLDFDRLKPVLIGEFKHYVNDGTDDDGNEMGHEESIPWTTIKEILTAAALPAESGREVKP